MIAVHAWARGMSDGRVDGCDALGWPAHAPRGEAPQFALGRNLGAGAARVQCTSSRPTGVFGAQPAAGLLP